MSSNHSVMPVLAGLCVALAGCAGSATPAAPAGQVTSGAATSSPTASAAASETASEPAAATGTLSTKSPDCATIERPKSLKRSFAAPPTMCAFESKTAFLAFRVFPSRTLTFEDFAAEEKAGSGEVLEKVQADGWTFAARWPFKDFYRVQYYLVDSKGLRLECKTGADGGEAELKQLLEVCNEVKKVLYKA